MMTAVRPCTAQNAFLCTKRKQKLEDSLAYQQFCANVDEEESWIGEKSTLVSAEDSGDTLAAVQVKSVMQ